MKKLFVALVVVGVLGVSGVAWGGEYPKTKEGSAKLAYDAVECSAFYIVFNACVPDKGLENWTLTFLDVSAELTDKELAISRMKIIAKSINKEMGDCSRISVPVNKYGEKCKNLTDFIRNLP